VPDAGLEACLEEGLAAAFFVAPLVAVVLLSVAFFTLDAGVFDAGFFPVTSFLAVSRREDEVVFLVEAVLLVDFEDGFNAFLVTGSALVFALVPVAFTGFAATLGSLASFFTAAFFVVVSLVSLAAGFLAAAGFAALVAVAVDLDLVPVDFAGVFLAALGVRLEEAEEEEVTTGAVGALLDDATVAPDFSSSAGLYGFKRNRPNCSSDDLPRTSSSRSGMVTTWKES